MTYSSYLIEERLKKIEKALEEITTRLDLLDQQNPKCCVPETTVTAATTTPPSGE
jgi:hypothetical protein